MICTRWSLFVLHLFLFDCVSPFSSYWPRPRGSANSESIPRCFDKVQYVLFSLIYDFSIGKNAIYCTARKYVDEKCIITAQSKSFGFPPLRTAKRIYIDQGSCAQLAAILHHHIKEAWCGQFSRRDISFQCN